MSTLSETVPPATIQEFESIDAYLQSVSEILNEGHMPDVSNLKDKISHLCSTAQNADPEIQKYCLTRLGVLLQKLKACEEQMNSFQAVKAQSEKK